MINKKIDPKFYRKSLFSILLFSHIIVVMIFIHSKTYASDLRHAMVRIYADCNGVRASDKGSLEPLGSGFIINSSMILTNAHVVDDQSDIAVRRFNQSERYRSKMLYFTREADLALLTVDDGRFFEGVLPLEFGELPDVGDEVSVYGFPGTEEIVIARGRYHGIVEERYLLGNSSFLAGHIRAEIRPGNSGSPVISGNKVAGIIMQATEHYDSGLMVPAFLIKHFLADISDGKSDDFH
ncbi:MAG: trypsin-like peptidase domain-containing protein [Nitrospirae bacterium]|nr:trypsin-like peptidase domain-containing protein [Nitrospirota bacterium]